MNWLIQLLGGGVLSSLADKISQAYEMKLKAETDEDKIKAEQYLAHLQAQLTILTQEQGRWYTAWIRPMIALPVVIYIWKLIVWDTILQWGVTINPGEFVNWVVLTVIGAYFLTRPFERRG